MLDGHRVNLKLSLSSTLECKIKSKDLVLPSRSPASALISKLTAVNIDRVNNKQIQMIFANMHYEHKI